jgi:hypothetical protein
MATFSFYISINLRNQPSSSIELRHNDLQRLCFMIFANGGLFAQSCSPCYDAYCLNLESVHNFSAIYRVSVVWSS